MYSYCCASTVEEGQVGLFPGFPNMLAAATVNGFQFSCLVFNLEHDSPITEATRSQQIPGRVALF